MPVQRNLSIDIPSPPWAWTPLGEQCYMWAIRRMRACGVSGLVADVGSGSGVGAGMLKDSGFDVVAIDMSKDVPQPPGIRMLRMSFRRDNVRRRRSFDAITMFGVLGWYEAERNIMEMAMRDAAHVFASTIIVPEWFNWMQPKPTITDDYGIRLIEWHRGDV